MPSATVGQLDTRVLGRIDNNSTLYGQSERYVYYNEAQRFLNIITGFLQTTVPVPGGAVANRRWYDTPAPIIIPLKVQFSGTYLHKSSLTRIGQTNPTWTQDTSANLGYPPASWVPVGLTKFGLHPANSIGGGEILVTGIQDPVLFTTSNPNQVLPFPNEYLEAMEDLSAFSIQLKEGFPLFQAANMLYQKFMARMGTESRWRNLSMPVFPIERQSTR
jgi:hypothetical protein